MNTMQILLYVATLTGKVVANQLDWFQMTRKHISSGIMYFLKVIILSPNVMCRLLHVYFQTVHLLLGPRFIT